MSQTKAQLVDAVDGSIVAADLASNSVTTAKVVDAAITADKLIFPVANRNLIINGAMQVAQRGTSSTTSGYGSVDRFHIQYDGGTVTHTQTAITSGSPYDNGFRNVLKLTNTATGSGTGNYRNPFQYIEAQNIATSGWNYASSSSFITLSFWVRSSVAQEFYGYLRTFDGTGQLYCFSLGSLSANTWTKITKTIPGNSNLQFDNDANAGLQVNIAPFWGGDFTTSGKTTDAWANFNTSSRTPDYANTWANTAGATFELTGVQLEVGSVATDFEHRSFAQELALCQRYFEKSYDVGTTAGTATSSGSLNNGGLTGVNNASHATRASIRYKVTKRASPTVTTFDLSGNSGKCNFPDTSSNVTMTVLQAGFNGCAVETAAVTSTDTRCYYHFTAESEL